MKIAPSALRLYAVTDRAWLRGRTLADQVAAVLAGGATCIQLREKAADRASRRAAAEELLPLCHRFGVPLVIDDDVALAKELDVAGVHVGQGDMDVAEACALLGPDKIVGATAHNVAEACVAAAAGADYLGCGAVFGSTTKDDTTPLSTGELRRICAAVDIPAVAIGGVNKGNMMQLKGTGIAGVAVVSALFAAEDEEAAARRLRRLAEEVSGCTQL